MTTTTAAIETVPSTGRGVGRNSWRDEGGWGDLILGRPETAVEPSHCGGVKAATHEEID